MAVHTPREYRLGETTYASEILVRFYGDYEWEQHYRLGVPWPGEKPDYMTEEEWRMLRGRMAEADAVVFMDKTVVVIEAKLMPRRFRGGLADLDIYRTLCPFTPEFRRRGIENYRFELWTTIEDALIKRECLKRGFLNPVWAPWWLPEYWKAVRMKERKAPGVNEFVAELLERIREQLGM